MRHRRRVKHFSRKSGPRKALIRGLVVSLVEHERISTTVDKAKELRRHVEKAITLGKKGDLATFRLLLSRIANEDTASKIVKDLSPRFQSRPGGYTRIIKIGRRPGDTAEMAFIEFVDYDYTKSETTKAAKALKGEGKKDAKTVKADLKEKAQTSKRIAKAHAAKKKSVARMQKASRNYNRD